MRDPFYERRAVRHFSGGWQVEATALARPSLQVGYPPSWWCLHKDGEYHLIAEDAMVCPQYPEFLRQVWIPGRAVVGASFLAGLYLLGVTQEALITDGLLGSDNADHLAPMVATTTQTASSSSMYVMVHSTTGDETRIGPFIPPLIHVAGSKKTDNG
jgi:hypothetical protein